MKKYLFILLLFSSCIGAWDTTIDLGDGYNYYNEGGDYSEITKQFRDINGKFVNIIIPKTILIYTYDNDYILAKQREKKNMKNIIQYWIIIKKKDSIIGPLNKSQFMDKLKIFSIPKKLYFIK